MIQFAKLSGFSPIITTASLQHEAYLKSLGATHLIDRHQPLSVLPEAVRAITSVPVKLVYDSISSPETQAVGYAALASGGTLLTTGPPAVPAESLKADRKIVEVFGSLYLPSNRVMGKELFARLEGFLRSGAFTVRMSFWCLAIGG